MFASRKPLAALIVTLVTAAACSPAGVASLAPSVSPTATAAATPARTPGPTSTATPTSIAVLPGELWIVYQQGGSDGSSILLVQPDGPEPHLLFSHAEHPDWSPDGKLIAVVAALANNISEIWTVNADGTDDKQRVSCSGPPCTSFGGPAWSPDGTQLAFFRNLKPNVPRYEDSQVAIEVLDVATGATRVVAMSPRADTESIQYVGPRWSPDGTQIVFAVHSYPMPPTDENIVSSSIAVVKADGSEVDSPRILTDPTLFAAYPDWSPDGQRIVFNTYPIGSFQDTKKAQNLYTIRPDGTELTQITHFGENDTRAIEPTWTPDGSRIIFVHVMPDANDPWGTRRIAFVDADGSNLEVTGWFGTHPRLRPTP